MVQLEDEQPIKINADIYCKIMMEKKKNFLVNF